MSSPTAQSCMRMDNFFLLEFLHITLAASLLMLLVLCAFGGVEREARLGPTGRRMPSLTFGNIVYVSPRPFDALVKQGKTILSSCDGFD